MPEKKNHQRDSQTLTRTKTRRKLERPRLYRVLFHNDDYTPMEFVVAMLMQIFRMSEVEATHIMLHVHNRGIGIAGVFPFSVAETKVNEVMEAAEKSEFPLLCTMEPAIDDDAGNDSTP